MVSAIIQMDYILIQFILSHHICQYMFRSVNYVSSVGSLQLQMCMYECRSESKERFAIQRYLLIIGKKQNMQVLSHTFTYFST